MIYDKCEPGLIKTDTYITYIRNVYKKFEKF